MDLRHDWKALNEVLFRQRGMDAKAATLALLEDEGRVVDGVVSNGRAFDDIGADEIVSNKEKLDALASKYATDQVIVFGKKNLDQALVDAAALGTNYYQQLQMLRTRMLEEGGSQRKDKQGPVVSRRHFVLDLFGGPIRRLLPRRFNVLLFVDERPNSPALSLLASQPTVPFSYRAILLSYQDGQLDQFYEPDFSSLHQKRLMQWQTESEIIGQYLESRYILPCYGIFMFNEAWEHCLKTAHEKGKPWRLFAKYADEGQASVYPHGILGKALLASQRIMVYFGRL